MSELLIPNESEIYPGEYHALPEIKALLESKIPHKDFAANQSLHMKQNTDCVKIEMEVPGVKREDIFVEVKNNILSISALQKGSPLIKPGTEGSCPGIFERHIALPVNAAPEFISAEYSHGILSLNMSKTEKPLKAGPLHVVVY